MPGPPRSAPLPPSMSQTSSPATPGKHLPVLDGVRGLAIALVMYQHFFHGIQKGPRLVDDIAFGLAYRSWMGVDLFFVLSGFLITGILWDAKSTAGYFKNFYARRVLRIFPAYYLILLILFVLLPQMTDAVRSYGGPSAPAISDQLWHWTYLTNFRISALGAWYHTNVPNVFWSLAIEEQFYMVWPLVVLMCSRRALISLCGLLFAAALGLRLVLAYDPDVNWVSSFVLTPARMDGLVLGAILALILRSKIDLARSRRIALGVGGLMLIPFVLLTFHRPEGFRELPIQATRFSVIALLFAAMLWLAVTGPEGKGLLGRVFCGRFLRMLGKYSYALYLWHGPAAQALHARYDPNHYDLIFGSRLPHALLFSLLALGLSLLLAWLSWNLVERHFLRLKDKFAPKVESSEGPSDSGPIDAGGPGALSAPKNPSSA